ncbi:MAG: PAS domain S-box protein [Candidatus Latescibacteria bacterium]|nr:PAS domain S-box protein [Candidatus Latescibacterota bacterium]
MEGMDAKVALNAIREKLLSAEEHETQIRVERSHLSKIVDALELVTLICDCMPDGVYVKDLTGRIVMTNSVGPRNIGKSANGIVGKTARELFSADSAQLIEQEDSHVISSGEAMSFEVCEPIDEQMRNYLTTKIPYRDDAGEIIGLLGLSRDITEQRQTEALNLVHETRFKKLLEAAPDAIVGMDHRGLIVLVNARVEHMFGYDRDELIGQPVEFLMPDRFRQLHTSHRSEYIGNPLTRPMGTGMELTAKHKDGREFPVEISLSPFETDEGMFVTSIIRDITDRKGMEIQLREHTTNLEEQVIQSERLATIGRMAAQVAHEIRNPLSTIGLNIELLADELDAHAWEERAEADDLIRITLSEIERLNSVITDYLQFARMPAKQIHELSVNDLAQDVSRFIRPEAAQMGIELNLELGDDMDAVHIDPIIFRQAVLNCIRNALEAMPDGGSLTIATSMKGFAAELLISDSGLGIAPEDQSRVFDPFYSTKDRGTGLGLPYVRQIVAEYGGTLDLKSTPGHGTSIAIRLPSSMEARS